MSKCPIIFGTLNKRHFLSLFLALGQIALILIYRFYPKKENNVVVQLYVVSIAEMLIKTFPCVLKISNIEEVKEQEKVHQTIQKKYKHYILYTLLFALNTAVLIGVEIFDFYLRRVPVTYTGSNLLPNHDFIILSVEMVFLVLISMYLLKYKYYKHHIISMVLFLIFGIISEIILQTYNGIDWKLVVVILMRIIGVGVNATYYCYQKYLMEKLYYPYWDVAFIPGVIMFILACIFLIIVLVNPDKEKAKLSFIRIFYLYFKTETGLAVGKVILVFVLHAVLSPLAILIIYYFGPNFVLTIFQFSRVVKNLTTIKKEKLYVIIFFVLQFISLMIHLELIELNFCGLNKYTKRNIELRGIDDYLCEGRDSVANNDNIKSKYLIDINKDYNIELPNEEKEMEIKETPNENII